jgi:hypothetical protein
MMGSTGADSGGDDSHDGRKGGKRELSQSKRAAQNRAAQVCVLVVLRRSNCWRRDEVARRSLKVLDGLLLCQFSCHQGFNPQLT